MGYEEKEAKEVKELEVITASIAQLTMAIQTQNEVLLCLLHKMDINSDLPTFQNKEMFEKEMGEKVEACVKAIRKIYGPSETDKS